MKYSLGISNFLEEISSLSQSIVFLYFFGLILLQGPHKLYEKAKWLSEEALQMAVKRQEAEGKGEKERYTYLNAEFQRIARRDKQAFLSDQCKEVEENNRMGKTRDLFKKIFIQRWTQ